MSEPLIRRINREQMLWRAVDVEQLIGEDHAARAIWKLVGRLDLDGFYEGIACSEEEGGRPTYDPRLLISLRTEEERASAVRDLWLGQSVSQSPEAAYSEGVDEGRVGMRGAKAGEELDWNARSITHRC